jgi:hypothetical protein
MASHESLPQHTHGSVPCRGLAFARAGLASLLVAALLGALIPFPPLLFLETTVTVNYFLQFMQAKKMTEPFSMTQARKARCF